MTPGTGAASEMARPIRIKLVLERILIPPNAIACLLVGVELPLATAVGDPIVISVSELKLTLVSVYRLIVPPSDLVKLLPRTM